MINKKRAHSVTPTASKILHLGFWALLFCSNTGLPQEPAPEKAESPYTLRVDVGMVVLHATVQDGKGRIVTGLQKENFKVAENGIPQDILLFQREDIPVTVGIILDSSGSMRNKRIEVIAAALAFAGSCNPQDEMFVVGFNDEVMMGLPPDKPFTSDVGDLRQAFGRFAIQGRTKLYDGLAAAINHLPRATHQKKVLVLVSDGGDNASQHTYEEVMEMADKSGAVVYTVGVYDETDDDRNPKVLKRVAQATGGQAFFPEGIADVTNICLRIAQDIRSQYTLGYFSKQDSGYHKLSATATDQRNRRLQVRTRGGYYASAVANRAPLKPRAQETPR
jgi:Ca-activated chloride channel homolog